MAGIVKGILSEETRKKIFMTAFIVYVAELVVFTSMYAKVEPLGRVFALIRVTVHDVEFDKIIKWSCLTHLGALLFVFASRYGGIIENRVYASSERVRDSIGFQFTTEGPNFFSIPY